MQLLLHLGDDNDLAGRQLDSASGRKTSPMDIGALFSFQRIRPRSAEGSSLCCSRRISHAHPGIIARCGEWNAVHAVAALCRPSSRSTRPGTCGRSHASKHIWRAIHRNNSSPGRLWRRGMVARRETAAPTRTEGGPKERTSCTVPFPTHFRARKEARVTTNVRANNEYSTACSQMVRQTHGLVEPYRQPE